MNLKKHSKNKKYWQVGIISLIVISILSLIIYRSYAYYEEKKEYDVIKGLISDVNYDVLLTYTKEDEAGNKIAIDQIPTSKDYTVEVTCDKSAKGEWDYENWGPVIFNLTENRTKCKIHFSALKPLFMDQIKNLNVVNSGSGLYQVEHNETDFSTELSGDLTTKEKENLTKTEYRFAGSNPNNYVMFNNELWRVIGITNTPEGSRVKLIRSESIGNYSWDYSATEINSGMGINEWRTSDLMRNLNELYYNRTSGTCYRNKTAVPCDFSNNGLTSLSRNMIETITWNTGANSNNTLKLSNFYNYERSNIHGKLCENNENKLVERCNDTITRNTTWFGKIGLIYPSDYGYATSGGELKNRTACFETGMSYWLNSGDMEDCRNNNWLYKGINQWTMTPLNDATFSISAYRISDSGGVLDNGVYNGFEVFPSIYLKPNIRLIKGTGTQDNPYIIVNTK